MSVRELIGSNERERETGRLGERQVESMVAKATPPPYTETGDIILQRSGWRERESERTRNKESERERQEKGEGFWNILTSEGRRFTGIPPYLFAYLQPWWNNGKGEGKRRTRRERERGQMSATVCKSAGGELITLRQPFPETPARKS